MDNYQFVVTGCNDEYQSATLGTFKNENFNLRITHTDMHPDDSFYIEAPFELSRKTIRELLDFVFPESKNEQRERKQSLDVEDYPELPDLYGYFMELIKEEQAGNLVLDWSINFGPVKIDLNEIVEDHCCLTTEPENGDKYKTLHLITDEYDVPFGEYDDPQAVIEDKKEFRGLYLHYMIANHGLKKINSPQDHGAVKDGLDYCESQNLIVLDKDPLDSDVLIITMTNQGEKKVKELEDECDYYVEKYDIFSNVYVEDEFIDFDTKDGIDLRIAAMRYDGLNPYRANIVINLFTGVFNNTVDNWEKEICSEKFFARYLGGAAVSEIELTDEEFEKVMIEGKRNLGELDED